MLKISSFKARSMHIWCGPKFLRILTPIPQNASLKYTCYQSHEHTHFVSFMIVFETFLKLTVTRKTASRRSPSNKRKTEAFKGHMICQIK